MSPMSRVLSCSAAPSEVPVSDPSVITATIDLADPVPAATWKVSFQRHGTGAIPHALYLILYSLAGLHDVLRCCSCIFL